MAAPKTRREWTCTEEAFLREHFASRGGKWCAEKLDRTHQSILGRVTKLGLVRENYTPHGSAAVPSFLDEAIRQAYRTKHRDGAVKRLAETYGVSRQSISRRALQIGARKHGRVGAWAPREIELLQTYAQATPHQMVRILKENGFKRTNYAVECARRKNSIDRASSEVHDLSDLARLLGVSVSTPRGWIRRGLIVPEPGTDVEGSPARISDLEIARFLTQHTTAYSLANLAPNHEWFIDLLVRKGALAAMSKPKSQREAVLQAAQAHPNLSPRQIAELLEMDVRVARVVISKLRSDGLLPSTQEAA